MCADWTSVETFGVPPVGKPVVCLVQHFHTKSLKEVELIRVDETDQTWRTSDDNSELSYDWTVTHYRELQRKG